MLLLTRPRSSAEAFVARLDRKVMEGVTVCFSPLIEILPVEADISLKGYAGVVFTSANAVRFSENGAGRSAYCVGMRTAEAAKAHGWDVSLAAQDADSLISAIEVACVEGPLLHLAGQHRRGEVAERLSHLGAQTDVAVIYDQILRPLTEEARGMISADARVIVPLFSPRTAAHFVSEVGSAKHVTLLAMSEAVADATAGVEAAELLIAKAPTGEEMRRAVEMLLAGDSLA